MCVCTHMYVHVCVHAKMSVCRSEDNLPESVLSSHHVDPCDQIQVISLGGKQPTNRASSPASNSVNIMPTTPIIFSSANRMCGGKWA